MNLPLTFQRESRRGEMRAPGRRPDSRTFSLWLASVFMVASCAVPVPPAGGPPDQDPPTLVTSQPSDGSVNQTVDRITFEFDERIDERSAQSAVSITPEFDAQVRLRARGNRLTIEFPEALRANTTYIITLDSKLRDAHSVGLKKPLTVAFGTGPTMNHGALRGTMMTASDGKPVAAIDVFAYAADSLDGMTFDRSPDYRTQTDDQGNFSLTYLREGPYFVLGVRDLNSNRRADPSEWTAVPPLRTVTADSSADVVPRPWVLSHIDTVPPEPLQARALNSRELEIRFSEPVLMENTLTDNWALADSLSGEQKQVEFMYAGENPRSIVLRIDSLADHAHRISGYGAMADSSGNRMRADTLYFFPSPIPFQQRFSFVAFNPDSLTATAAGYFRLWPSLRAGIRFGTSPGPSWLDRVTVTDTSGTPIGYSPISRDGLLYELFGDEIRQPVEVTVQEADTLHSRIFVRAGASATGEIGGTVSSGNRNDSVLVELIRDGADTPFAYRVRADSDGKFLFTGLPGGSRYLVRAFLDRNGDGAWSKGAISPYEEPEPIGWSLVEEPVRARWETVLPDTLFILRD